MNNALMHLKIIKVPELRYTQGNQKPFAVAIAEGADPRGEKPFQIKLIIWGEKAEQFATDVNEEGDRLVVEGSVDIQEFERDGIKRKYAEMTVNRYQPAEVDLFLNSINLVGRAGRDPDIQYFESGKVVAKFSIAVNRIGRDAPPNWFDVEIWGKPAEVAGNYVRKGSLIGVNGYISVDEWNDRATGESRSKPKVTGDRLHLLGSKRDNDAPDYEPSSLPLTAQPAPSAAPQTVRPKATASVGRSPSVEPDYDDIPF